MIISTQYQPARHLHACRRHRGSVRSVLSILSTHYLIAQRIVAAARQFPGKPFRRSLQVEPGQVYLMISHQVGNVCPTASCELGLGHATQIYPHGYDNYCRTTAGEYHTEDM